MNHRVALIGCVFCFARYCCAFRVDNRFEVIDEDGENGDDGEMEFRGSGEGSEESENSSESDVSGDEDDDEEASDEENEEIATEGEEEELVEESDDNEEMISSEAESEIENPAPTDDDRLRAGELRGWRTRRGRMELFRAVSGAALTEHAGGFFHSGFT